MSDLTDRLRARAHGVYALKADAEVMERAADALDAAEAENAQLREDYGNLAAELGQVIVGYRQQLAAIDAIVTKPWDGTAASAVVAIARILHPEEEE